jgi:hypothetical protein
MSNADRRAALQLLAEERIGRAARAEQYREDAAFEASKDELRRRKG